MNELNQDKDELSEIVSIRSEKRPASSSGASSTPKKPNVKGPHGFTYERSEYKLKVDKS